MLPDQAIKEEFQTLVVLTTEGQIYQGIVADRDNQRIVLKEATGDLRTIPVENIEDQKEGGSLMPKGLPNLMTHDEFVDIVRFLSELGKPGPYAIRTTPTIQRWRVLTAVPEALARKEPSPETFESEILNTDPDRWRPAYAKVSGSLPLANLASLAGGPVLYLQGEIDVTVAGAVAFRLDNAQGLNVWVDDQPVPAQEQFTQELEAGRHRITFRVDTNQRDQIRVEVAKPENSTAELSVVGGR